MFVMTFSKVIPHKKLSSNSIWNTVIKVLVDKTAIKSILDFPPCAVTEMQRKLKGKKKTKVEGEKNLKSKLWIKMLSL